MYRGVDERLQREVALKRVHPDIASDARARRRFRREARSVARLSHPGIVRVYDWIEKDEHDWIVMELVEGSSLYEMTSGGGIDLETGLETAIQIADALAAAHYEGVVHRDLKSKNILVTSGRKIKILDFGLAKQVFCRPESSASLTVLGQLVGTPHAMSPEQALGKKVDLRTDLFSFGSLLYEIFTGIAPFLGKNPLESLERVCSQTPPDICSVAPRLPRALGELVG